MVVVLGTRSAREEEATMATGRAGSLVIFGITGDLAKKLVLPALYRLEERKVLDEPILGVARSQWDKKDLVKYAHDSVMTQLGAVNERVFARLAKRLSYVAGDYSDAATFDEVKRQIGARAESAVYYLAVPPPLFSVVAAALAREGLAGQSRLVVEKPFGSDLASARELDVELQRSFTEQQIFRVDHFLGKESVEDLLVFRFANSLFAPVWNRETVKSVQLTFAEDLDVADRGGFYDPVGAIRDVVQNHLFQVVANLAMDPPAGADPGAEKRERARLLRSVRALTARDVVRGQYRGYLDVAGVKPGSWTETYVAMRLRIDNARWDGVPFYLRTGKCLPTTRLEAVIELVAPPRLALLSSQGADFTPNLIRIRMQPGSGVICEIQTKRSGPLYTTRPVELTVDFEQGMSEVPLPYERVLSDALDGSDAHFASMDGIEESWRILEGVLEPKKAPVVYDPATWGPDAAENLPGRDGWLPLSTASLAKP
jgi:glucose-6-phosphate 1-dehydrogenase